VPGVAGKRHSGKHRYFYVISHFFYSFRIKRGDLIVGNMLNNEETGPSDHDADEMDYEGEQQYLDFLSAKHSQVLQGGLNDGTDADIDTGGVGTDGGAETGGEGTGGEDTGGEGTGAEAATEKKKKKK
jgi:hypothetical protein